MNTLTFRGKQFLAGSLAVLGLSTLSTGLFAQPVVTYTASGTSGDYTLNFTVNNTTPGRGEDIYFFGVLTDGSISSTPSGYYSTFYANTVYFYPYPLGVPVPFNNTWIDPTYTVLPSGNTLSGFTVLDTDATVPASVPYFAVGTGFDGSAVSYTGPDNLGDNSTNPLFVGNAVLDAPEPTTMTMIAGSLLLLRKLTLMKTSP